MQSGVKAFERFWEAFSDKRARILPEGVEAHQGHDGELVERIVAAAELYASHRPAIIERGGTPKMLKDGWLIEDGG